jgi:hypothetical protein
LWFVLLFVVIIIVVVIVVVACVRTCVRACVRIKRCLVVRAIPQVAADYLEAVPQHLSFLQGCSKPHRQALAYLGLPHRHKPGPGCLVPRLLLRPQLLVCNQVNSPKEWACLVLLRLPPLHLEDCLDNKHHLCKVVICLAASLQEAFLGPPRPQDKQVVSLPHHNRHQVQGCLGLPRSNNKAVVFLVQQRLVAYSDHSKRVVFSGPNNNHSLGLL